MAATATAEQGWTYYRLGEFGPAIECFDAILAAHPEVDPRRLSALYGLATCWNLRTPIGDQNKELARSLYGEVIAAAPKCDLAAWSALAMARITHLVPVGETPDYDAVRAAYEDVVTQFPEHLAGHEAFVYLQSLRVQTLDATDSERAVAELLTFIEQHPDSGLISGLHALLAACYETLHQPERQLAAEIRALETLPVDAANPKHENSGRYWRIATIAEFEAGDFKTARDYYRRLIKEYPQDIRIYASEQALERMDVTERALGGTG